MKRKKESGFTLTEVLIVLAASAIIGTILVTILVQGSSIFSSQNATVNQNLSLNNASNQITQSIKFASTILTSYTNNQITYTTNNQTIILKIPSINNQGNVIDNKFDTLIIMPDSNKPKILRKMIFPDPTSSRKSDNAVIASNLSQIQFNYLNDSGNLTSPSLATRIDFVIKVSENLNNSTKESSISGRINLKNI